MTSGQGNCVYIVIAEPPIRFRDGNFVARHLTGLHATIIVKDPMFDTVAAHPLARDGLGRAVFVVEFHCDAIVLKGEELFSEPIVMFSLPLLNEKRPDLRMTAEETVSVAPDGVFRIRLEAERSVFRPISFQNFAYTFSGSRLFHKFCAVLTFVAAECMSNDKPLVVIGTSASESAPSSRARIFNPIPHEA